MGRLWTKVHQEHRPQLFTMPDILDDKSEHCIPFILERLEAHREAHEGSTPPPFFLGLNGVQGAGKTTLVGVPSGFKP